MRIHKCRDSKEIGPRGFMRAGTFYLAAFTGRDGRNRFAWARTPQSALVAARRKYGRGHPNV